MESSQPTTQPPQAQTPTAPAQLSPAQILQNKRNSIAGLLGRYSKEFEKALPKFITPERLIRVALTAITKTPKLLDCDQRSLISCLLTSAQLGLMPDGILGEAYLIPFENGRGGRIDCTFIPGYRGLLALAYRSGQVKSITARAVYKGDDFVYSLGLEEKLEHVPKGNKNPNDITHFYAIVRFHNGGHNFIVMTAPEVYAVRDASANYKFSKKKEETVWAKYPEEMGCKTVLRRLMKYTPLSPEINRAVGLDEAAEMGKQNLNAEILSVDGASQEDKNAVFQDLEFEMQEEAEQRKQGQRDEMESRAQRAEDSTLGMIGGQQ